MSRLKDQCGACFVEYLLLLGIVSLGVVVVIKQFSDYTSLAITSISRELGGSPCIVAMTKGTVGTLTDKGTVGSCSTGPGEEES